MLLVDKEELKQSVGKVLEPSDWFEIGQSAIDQFADITLDRQFIHVDREKAQKTPFGTTIAHGFLSLSMITHLLGQGMLVPDHAVMGLNYGFDKVRFLSPVKSGSSIRACAEIAFIPHQLSRVFET